MNWDSWNKLPPDIQAIFSQKSGIERTRQIGAACDGLMTNIKKMLNDYDIKVGNPPVSDFPADEMARWQRSIPKVQDRWVEAKEKEGIPARAILQDV